MMKLVNLTPHAINFVTADGRPILTVEPSGTVARVAAKTVFLGEVYAEEDELTRIHTEIDCLDGTSIHVVVENIHVTGTNYGEVEGLPAPEEGVVYIVSSLVAQRCHNRDDVFIPNESVRDENGRIIGCRSLGRV